MKHGTMDAYSNHGCRCERCRKANRDHYRERYTVPCRMCGRLIYTHGSRHKASLERRSGLCIYCYSDTRPIPHGTETGYCDHRCRCDECRRASAEARRRRRAAHA